MKRYQKHANWYQIKRSIRNLKKSLTKSLSQNLRLVDVEDNIEIFDEFPIKKNSTNLIRKKIKKFNFGSNKNFDFQSPLLKRKCVL